MFCVVCEHYLCAPQRIEGAATLESVSQLFKTKMLQLESLTAQLEALGSTSKLAKVKVLQVY